MRKKTLTWLSLGLAALLLVGLLVMASTASAAGVADDTNTFGKAKLAYDPNAQHWQVLGTSDASLTAASATWWPDSHGGIGVVGSTCKGDPDRQYLAGGTVQFDVDDIYKDVLARVLPTGLNDWYKDLPLASFASLSLEANTKSGDLLFVVSSGVRLFPKYAVNPVVQVNYLVPEGGKLDTSKWQAAFGAAVKF
jgi:hypothetical protein